MFITNITPIGGDEEEIRSYVLKAELRDNRDKLVLASTLYHILLVYFDRQDEIHNYKEAFQKYVKCMNDDVIENFSLRRSRVIERIKAVFFALTTGTQAIIAEVESLILIRL